MSSPPTRRDKLIADPLHGLQYLRLRQAHQVVAEPTWRKSGNPARCTTCKTLWPCEVGQALAIVNVLLVWMKSGAAQ